MTESNVDSSSDKPRGRRGRLGCILSLLLGLLAIIGVAVVGPRETLQRIFLILSEDTEYAEGFSHRAFRSLELGTTETQALDTLGEPLEEWPSVPYTAWLYAPDPELEFNDQGTVEAVNPSYTQFLFDAEGILTDVIGQVATGGRSNGFSTSFTAMFGPGVNTLNISAQEIDALKQSGANQALMEERYGAPQSTHEHRVVRWLRYTRSPTGSNYRQRAVGIDKDGHVCAINDSIWWD